MALMILIAIYELTIGVRTYFARRNTQYLSEHQNEFTAAVLIATIVRVLIDVYLYSLLGYLVAFFYRKKRQSLQAQLLPFTVKSQLILAWVILLVVLNSLYRIVITVQFGYVIRDPLSTSIYLPSVAVYVFTIFPLTTFLTASTLTYLFFYQAVRAEEVDIGQNCSKDGLSQLLSDRDTQIYMKDSCGEEKSLNSEKKVLISK